MDYDREDLVKLLACLQSELEAREDVIRNLKKSLKQSHFDYHPKYGLTGSDRSICASDSTDPFSALARDSITSVTSPACCEDSLKSTYDNQLVQLENLISSQRHAREVIRERLSIVEEKYQKTCNALESPNAETGSTGKDYEKLQSELEQEKAHCKQLEQVIKRILSSWRERCLILLKQKHIGALLLKERRHLLTQSVSDKRRIGELESLLETFQSCADAESKPKFTSSTNDGTQENVTTRITDLRSVTKEALIRKCEHLMQTLDEEVASRASLEANFERLQMNYNKLLPLGATSSRKMADVSLIDSFDPSLDSPFGQRPKPDPPKRRSSEITNPHSNVVYHDPTDLNDKFEVSMSITNEPTTSSRSDAAGSASPYELKTIYSESRSSTPSPPPPPVQLHFPYPGMQTHENQQQVKNRNPATNKLLFVNSTINRPLSGSQSINNPITSVHKTRSLTTSPHPTAGILFPQQQLPYRHPMSSNRPHLPQIQDPRPHTQLNTIPSSPYHSISQLTPPTYRPAQVRVSSDSAPIAELFVHTTVALTNTMSLTNNAHHFPAYSKSPHRSHYALHSHLSSSSSSPQQPPSADSGQKNVRPTRIAIPSSTALTEGRTPGSGHLCIGGK